jgi:hypothetical protein
MESEVPTSSPQILWLVRSHPDPDETSSRIVSEDLF